MKAQRKSLIGSMNRHNGPANAAQYNVAAMLAEINPPQYNAQHALPMHQYNNQNIHLGWECYVCLSKRWICTTFS